MSKRVDHLCEILKKYDGNLEMYLNPNSSEKLETIDIQKLSDDVTKWSNLSAQGLVCGILGCSEDPKNKCQVCSAHYCSEHVKWHFHSAHNTGILQRDSSEMR